MTDYDKLIRKRVRRRLFEVMAGRVDPYSLLLEAPEDETAPAVAEPAVEAGATAGKAGKLSKEDKEALRKRDGGEPKASNPVTAAAKKEAEKKAPGVEMVVDTEGTAKGREMLLSQAAVFEKGFDLIKESDGLAIAKAIYDATKGRWGGTGMGTDEEAVQTAIKSIPTLMDASFISYIYEEKYGDSLESNFESEFSDTDMYEYVEIPLKELPFISVAGKKYALDELNTLAKSSAELIEKGSEEQTSGEMALGAAGTVAGAAAGTAAAVASAGAIIGGAAGFGAAWAAPALASTAFGGTAAGLMGIGAGGLATGGISLAGTGFAAGASAASVGAGVTGGAAAALAAVPGPGWVGLGVLILGAGAYMMWGKDSTMDDAVAGSLNSGNYVKMQEFFKSTAAQLKVLAADYEALMPKPEDLPEEGDEEEDEEEGGGAGKYAVLPFRGLSKPHVKNIQVGMNEYCDTRGISSERIAEDGKWGPETTRRWSTEFAGHALDNTAVGDSDSGASITDADTKGKGSWAKMSAKLSGEFPGYTAGRRGCLAFVVDAYNDNLRYGGMEGGEDEPRRRRGGGGGSAGATAVTGAGLAATKASGRPTKTQDAGFTNEEATKKKHWHKLTSTSKLSDLPSWVLKVTDESNPRVGTDWVSGIWVHFNDNMQLLSKNMTGTNIRKIRFQVGRKGVGVTKKGRAPDIETRGNPDAIKLAKELMGM